VAELARQGQLRWTPGEVDLLSRARVPYAHLGSSPGLPPAAGPESSPRVPRQRTDRSG
jgi:hypothetical protein